jgi:hypothetical protein
MKCVNLEFKGFFICNNISKHSHDDLLIYYRIIKLITILTIFDFPSIM